ncbi:MAG: hypothetical protein HY673_09210 [Chloroflexi bacterium]|nr:hypothetical protein [Chloroflexota bacterium]
MKGFFRLSAVACLLLVFVAAGCGGESGATPAPSTPRPAATTPAPPGAATAVPTVAPTSPGATAKAPPPAGPAYYQGKTIEMVVASAAGGPTDMNGRAAATFYPEYLPGSPKVIIRNVPGGGGSVAVNNFVEKTKPDGLNLLAAASSALNNQRLGIDIVRYDLRKVKFISSLSRAESLVFVRKEALPRLTDPNARALVVGGREGTESWQAMPMWGREFLGWNVRWIIGFAGSAELELAMRRGEIDMFGTADASVPQRLVEEGVATVVAQIGSFDKGKWMPRADYPDVPVFATMLQQRGVAGLPWQAYLGWTAPGSSLDRWLASAPGTPDNVMGVLIDSYKRMARDQRFDSMVKKTITPIYTLSYGEDVAAIVKDLLDSPPEAVEYPLQLQKKFGIVR